MRDKTSGETSVTGLTAGHLLRQTVDEILGHWMDRCREELPAARHISKRALQDSLPEFLEEVARNLEVPNASRERRESHVAAEHGYQRVEVGDYTLDEVIREYHLLRQVLLEDLEAKAEIGKSARAILHQSVDVGVREAAIHFVKASELALRESLAREKRLGERLAKAASIAKIGFFEWDIRSDRIDYSKQMMKDWGIPGPGPIRQALELIHPQDRKRVSESIMSAVEQRLPFVSRYRILGPEGRVVWIEAEGRVTYGENDEPKRFFGTTQDVTRRISIEQALASEQHKLESIFRDAPAAMALWRGETFVFDMVNPAYQAIFGDRQLEGLPLLDAIPELHGQPFPSLLERVLATGESYVGREELARLRISENAPLEDRYYDFTYLRVDTPDGQAYGVFDHAIDVTERVIGRKALEASESKLRNTVEALQNEKALRERFVATLSHDLRSPLAVARISADVIARNSEVPPSAAKNLAKIQTNIDRVDLMIQNLLDVSRLQSGEPILLDFVLCSLNDVLSGVIEDMQAIYGNRFVVEIPAKVVGMWNGDALRRIFGNLASNAAKYGDPTKPVSLWVRCDTDFVAVRVHNEGNPLGDTERELIFEPFKRSTSAEQGSSRGWGLGLTLVRAMTEVHRGRIEVESSEGDGTTFSVLLPWDSRVTRSKPVGQESS